MAKDNITGLVVSADLLEWVSLQKGKDGLVVEASGSVSLARASVKAEDGTVSEEPADVYEKRVKEELAKIRGEPVVALRADRLILRVLSLPDVPDTELKSMIGLQVDKFSPFPAEQLVVSHEVLSRKEGNCQALVAAAHLEDVEALGKLLKMGKMEAGRIDAATLGWWKLLKDAGAIQDAGRQVFLLMLDKSLEMLVFHDGVPIVFRTLAPQGEMPVADFASETAHEIGFTLMSLELEHGGAGVTSVTVWHRGEKPELLAQHLKEECSCEVLVKSLEAVPSLAEGVVRRAAEGVDKLIDLVPESWRARDEAKVARGRILSILYAILGIWLVAVIVFFGGIFYQQKRLAYLQERQKKWVKMANDVRDTRRRVETIQKYMDSSHSVLETLRLVTSVQPGGQAVTLTSFSYKKGEEANVQGEASSVDLVYAFKTKIDESKFFVNSTLVGPTHDPKRSRWKFEITMKLPGGTTK